MFVPLNFQCLWSFSLREHTIIVLIKYRDFNWTFSFLFSFIIQYHLGYFASSNLFRGAVTISVFHFSLAWWFLLSCHYPSVLQTACNWYRIRDAQSEIADIWQSSTHSMLINGINSNLHLPIIVGMERK